MRQSTEGNQRQPPTPGFLRDPLSVGLLTLIAPVLYFYWWLWQFFRVARRERFAHIRSYLSVFVPIFNYVALYQLFKDLERRLDRQSGVRFKARTAILMLMVGHLVSIGSLGAREPNSILFLALSLAFPAVVTYRVQGAINAYLQRSDPLRVPQTTGLGEVAAVVLGVTLLGLDVLGATKTLTAQQQANAVTTSLPAPTPSPTPRPTAGPFPSSGDGLTIVTEQSDWIGQGAAFTYDRQDASFTVLPGAVAQPGIGIEVKHGDQFWEFVFSPPSGQTLHVGTYSNARGVPAPAGSPGLSVSGAGHGCNSFGSFTISAISFDSNGQLVLLDASFIQHCDSPVGPSLVGRIRYEPYPEMETNR